MFTTAVMLLVVAQAPRPLRPCPATGTSFETLTLKETRDMSFVTQVTSAPPSVVRVRATKVKGTLQLQPVEVGNAELTIVREEGTSTRLWCVEATKAGFLCKLPCGSALSFVEQGPRILLSGEFHTLDEWREFRKFQLAHPALELPPAPASFADNLLVNANAALEQAGLPSRLQPMGTWVEITPPPRTEDEQQTVAQAVAPFLPALTELLAARKAP